MPVNVSEQKKNILRSIHEEAERYKAVEYYGWMDLVEPMVKTYLDKNKDIRDERLIDVNASGGEVANSGGRIGFSLQITIHPQNG